MYKYKIFNNIAPEGIDYLVKENLILNEDEPEALLLRSKVLSENNFNDQLLCIGRAGAGVNNIPIDIASKRGVVVFNTPGANANAVKELVLCGLLLSSRGIIQGNSFALKVWQLMKPVNSIQKLRMKKRILKEASSMERH